MSQQKVKKLNAEPAVEPRHFKRGECVYANGEHGQAWRVVSGAVRLDTIGPDGPSFGSLALSGDVIGAEALVSGRYSFQARALTPCVLTPWREPKTSLLGLFTATQGRAAELIALRGGRAADRVARLLRLLSGAEGATSSADKPVMPRLRDVADITDLTIETVSRVAASPTRTGNLSAQRRRNEAIHPTAVLAVGLPA